MRLHFSRTLHLLILQPSKPLLPPENFYALASSRLRDPRGSISEMPNAEESQFALFHLAQVRKISKEDVTRILSPPRTFPWHAWRVQYCPSAPSWSQRKAKLLTAKFAKVSQSAQRKILPRHSLRPFFRSYREKLSPDTKPVDSACVNPYRVCDWSRTTIAALHPALPAP